MSPTQGGTCLNRPRSLKAQKVTKKFKSKHPYFTLLIEQSKLEENATVHRFNTNAGHCFNEFIIGSVLSFFPTVVILLLNAETCAKVFGLYEGPGGCDVADGEQGLVGEVNLLS